MKRYIKLEIQAGTIADMTVEQFTALRDNICAEGKWDSLGGDNPPATNRIDISGGDYLGVHLPGIFIGIEKDGYTHS